MFCSLLYTSLHNVVVCRARWLHCDWFYVRIAFWYDKTVINFGMITATLEFYWSCDKSRSPIMMTNTRLPKMLFFCCMYAYHAQMLDLIATLISQPLKVP